MLALIAFLEGCTVSINSQINSQFERKFSSETDENMIVERIYRAVMEQRLAPNTKLSEASLCETFNVGRMHVRRALLLLSSQGIIDLHSNRGAYVACPDKSEAQDVFAARTLIEPPLVRQLAQEPNEVISLRRKTSLQPERLLSPHSSGSWHRNRVKLVLHFLRSI